MYKVPRIEWSALELGRLIGQGGFADVYQGRWHGADVAIKQLKLATMPADIEAGFLRETDIHGECNFPRIVRLLAITHEPGYFALVMEYLPKGSLYDSLHNSSVALPWPVRWQMAIDIGSGLGYLHGKKILHEDLKSLNVLLDTENRAKIADFGLSQVCVHTAASTKKGDGSIRWRAPETFTRRYKYTSAADVYSYGMLLWEIASRALPYADEANDVVVMGFIKDGDTEDIPADCPPAYRAQIERSWLTASQRPTATDIQQALEIARPVVTPKSWQAAPAPGAQGTPAQSYTLFPASPEDIVKVVAQYNHAPVPGYDIASVEIIHNPALESRFAGQLTALEHRHTELTFKSRWPREGNAEEQAARRTIDEWHQQQATPHQDSDAPHVRILPLWHGTNPTIVDSICRAGYATLGPADDVELGRGIYSTHEAEYAYRVYATQNYTEAGVLLLNWVASYSAYPVIHGDVDKLSGRGNYQNYDAHLIPVKPHNPANAMETRYNPCRPHEPHTYTEMVVFEAASCLPRYRVHLQPSLPRAVRAATPPQPVTPLPVPRAHSTIPPLPARRPSRPAIVSAPTTVVALSLAPNPALQAALTTPSTPLGSVESPLQLVPGEIPYQQGLMHNFNMRYAEALACYKTAAASNHQASYLRLFLLYRDEHRPNFQNLSLAAQWRDHAASCIGWFIEQAQTGNAEAQYNLAICYEYGVGVTENAREAMRLYSLAARQEDTRAQINLGLFYERGIGVAKNAREAVRLYRLAATQGDKRAQYNLDMLLRSRPDLRTGVI